jgi:hypothetical protein
MSSRKTVIVTGYLIRNTGGGHVLSILHYLDGLQQLGYEVVFLEHFGWAESCYDPTIGAMSDDPGHGISVIAPILHSIGVERWCYVGPDGIYHGMSRQDVLSACRSAEFLVSLWLVTWMEEMRECRYRIFIDLDPGFTQFPMSPLPVPARDGYASPYEFDIHFSYGTRIGAPDCPIPTHGIVWHPLLPPVSLRLLPPIRTTDCGRFTTVMGWNSRTPIVYKDQEYGQKDVEFRRVIDLPKRLPEMTFEIALGGGSAPRAEIASAGWKLVDPQIEIPTPERYLDYIAGSSGEFSVAVNLEVKARSGWFSDRTAAYLASGKPAVVQETGFSEFLPTGEGLLAFGDLDGAVAAIEAVCSDYQRHCRIARELAEEYLDARKVLGRMLGSTLSR